MSEVESPAELEDEARPDDAAAGERDSGDLARMAKRLQEVSIPTELGDGVLRADFPNGRETRTVVWHKDQVRATEDLPVEQVRFVGDYQAVWETATDCIEARLSSVADRAILHKVPGVERLSREGDWLPWRMEDRVPAGIRLGSASAAPEWRIRLERGGVIMEIGGLSRLGALMLGAGAAVRPRVASLRILGAGAATHDEALNVLEDLSNALFFDLDLRYGVALQLHLRPNRGLRNLGPMAGAPPRFPENIYSNEAVTLYQYGRSAHNLPLLQFLAYYQVLEFFFPLFTRQEGIRELRTRLQDRGSILLTTLPLGIS